MFEKGQMYMLRGLAKNKRHNAMCDMDGSLYLADSQSWARGRYTRYTDGAIFVCLQDSPEFDVEAFKESLHPAQLEYATLDAVARAKGAHDYHRTVELLTPSGTRVTMRVKGNKTKFKKVTSRTRVKR